MDREFASNSSGMMGEVMNLEDFLDELSEPDPKLVNNNENTGAPPSSTSVNTSTSSGSTHRYMYNPLANLEVMFNSANYYQLQNQQIQIQNSSMISKNGKWLWKHDRQKSSYKADESQYFNMYSVTELC